MPSLAMPFQRILCALVLLLCLLTTSSAQAANRLVPSQYATIQAAIDAAAVGDTVLLADGTYTGVGNRDLDFGGKDITVRSQSGDPTKCILDCQLSGRGFIFQHGETAASTVADLTIQNGRSGLAGGMYIYQSNPTISHCIFTGNQSGFGGGIFTDTGSNPTVTNCTFTANWANTFGGGMYNYNNISKIINCTFTGNQSGFGGGMYNDTGGNPTVTNCTFTANQSAYGGGIYNYECSPVITNDTFTGNQSTHGGGGIFNDYHSRPLVTNCIIWGDTSSEVFNATTAVPVITYCDVKGGYAGTGNINLAPLFVRSPFTNGPADYGDLHLQSGSSCLDSGSNAALPPGLTTDLDGYPRIAYGTVDLGAYEIPSAFTVTAQVQVTRGGFRRNATTGRYTQTVTLKNMGTNTLTGPISLTLDSLSANAALYNKTGTTSATPPSGSPYLDSPGSLAPGASVTLTLEFTNPTNTAITYTTRVLAGPNAR